MARGAAKPGEVASEDLAGAWMRHMRAGEWSAAWRVSDRVLASHAGETCWHLPRHKQWIWDGTPLHGKRVLVRCYHGLGDTLQFIRYAPLLRDIGAEATFWVQPALIPLLRTVPGIGTLLPLHDGEAGMDYDVDVEIMELSHVFRSTPETLPADVPYLHVPPAPPADDGRLHVGLVWKAGDWDDRRSIPVHLLAPLAKVPGVALHVLQRGSGLAERPAGFGTDSGSDDPLAAAETMRAMDLVVTMDSMPAHLAGALGVPVWTLLQAEADWRWMDDRDDSPWYPTMRLFRQEQPGEWAPVIARVVHELKAMRSGG
jgi:hypothetical protein